MAGEATAQPIGDRPWPGEEDAVAAFDEYVSGLPEYLPVVPRPCPECKAGAWETVSYENLTWWNVHQTGPCCTWFASARALGLQFVLNCALGYGTSDPETAAACGRIHRVLSPPDGPYVPPAVAGRYRWFQLVPPAGGLRIMWGDPIDSTTWEPLALSPQFLFECMPGTWSSHCGGAEPREVFDGLVVVGMPLWSVDPPGVYDWDVRDACLTTLEAGLCAGAGSPPCQFSFSEDLAMTGNDNANCSLLDFDRDGLSDAAGRPVVRIAGSGNIFSARFEDIPAILDEGKVLTTSAHWDFPDLVAADGILECGPSCADGGPDCGKDHAVVIIGYEQHGRVLLIANSHGERAPLRIWATAAAECNLGARNVVIGDLIVRDASESPFLESDTDGDGFPLVDDLCPYVWNPPEETFVSSDGDEWPDACDRCRNPGLGTGYEWYRWDLSDNADQDSDGIGSACDANPYDGSVAEYAQGLDNDDCDEFYGEHDRCPLVGHWDRRDRDGDGRWDDCDACPDDPTVEHEGQFEFLYSGAPTTADDADRVTVSCDNCPRTTNGDQRDDDGDGTGDACDLCRGDPSVRFDPADYRFENYLGDPDHDGRPTVCRGERTDSCPSDNNRGQEDHDSDGLGDVCDGCPGGSRFPERDEDYSHAAGYRADDADRDFILDWCDVCPLDTRSWSAGMYDGDPDCDGDTYPDDCDNCPGRANADQANCNALWEETNHLVEDGDACDADLCVDACCPRDLGGAAPSLLYGGTYRTGALNMRGGEPASLDVCYLGGTAGPAGPTPRYGELTWLNRCDCLDAENDRECALNYCLDGLTRPELAGHGWRPLRWEDSTGHRASLASYPELGGAAYPEKRRSDYRPLYDTWPSAGGSWSDRPDWLHYAADELNWDWADDHAVSGPGGEVSVRLWLKPDRNMDDAWAGDLYWPMTRLRWPTAAEDSWWDHLPEWGRPPEGPIDLPRPDEAAGMRDGWMGGWYEVPDLIGPGCPWCNAFRFPQPGRLVEGMWVVTYRPDSHGFLATPRPVRLVAGTVPDRSGMATSIIRNADGTIARAAFFGGPGPDGAPESGLWDMTPTEDQSAFELRQLDAGPDGEPAPVGRTGATLVHRPNGRVLLLGGEAADGFLDTAWQFDVQTAGWQRTNVAGLPPTWSHVAAAELGGRLYAFGGRGERGVHGSLYRLDLDTLQAEFLGPARPPTDASVAAGGVSTALPLWPTARSDGRLAAKALRRELWLYGGFDANGRPLNDLWAYALDTNRWRQVRKQCDGPACPVFRPADLFLGAAENGAGVVLPDPAGPDGKIGAWFDTPEGWIPSRQVVRAPGWNDCDGDGAVEPNVGLRCGGGTSGWPDTGRTGCTTAGDDTACRLGGSGPQAEAGLTLATTGTATCSGHRVVVGTPGGILTMDGMYPGGLVPAWTTPTCSPPRDVAAGHGFVLGATGFSIAVLDERTGERVRDLPTCGVPRRILVVGDQAVALGLQSATLVDLAAPGGPTVVAREQYWHLGPGRWMVTRSPWLCLAAAARDVVCSLSATCRDRRNRMAGDVSGRYLVGELDGELLAFERTDAGLTSLGILPNVGELAGLRNDDSLWYGAAWDTSNPTFEMQTPGLLERKPDHDVADWVLSVVETTGLRVHVRPDELQVRWYERE
jgi:hypothetical protein